MLTGLAVIGAVVVFRRCLSLYRLLCENRDGNSGRMKHWTEE